jgi:pyruvate formate lyase activating enzyme
MESEGLVLHLQRLSTEDGPGIRTTVFFKGCPMRCAWCHNPESMALAPQVQWLETRCIGCNTCLSVCPEGCLSRPGASLAIDRQRCSGCGICAEECPTGSLELLGRRVSSADLLAELLKDRAYYAASAGGVTLSGGEPAMQPAFAAALLAALKDAGVHTALDTCGLCSRDVLARLSDLADLVLFDVKLLNEAAHLQWTGQSNRVPLHNLEWLASQLRDHANGKQLWVRTPLIPGATDGQENVTSIGAYLADKLGDRLDRWELCAFNNLCRDKYRRLGMTWAYQDAPLLSCSDLDRIAGWARSSGVDPQRVFVTGAARVENLTSEDCHAN